jgi:hypothetical protein
MRTVLISCFGLFMLTGCSKGYELRFSNYYTERIDSVSIGSALTFTSVSTETSTDYLPINRGQYEVRIASAGKKRFRTSIFIPGNGSGKRTVQIDGIGQVSYIEQ